MRLQKFISRSGYASRRKAEELIRAGHVQVNGETVTDMGIVVDPETDAVSVEGTRLRLAENKIYILLNKPEGVVTTLSDNFNRPIVTDFVDINERIYPVGRLDYDSKGLVLLTNDGDLAYRLTHPRHHVPKTYLVRIDKSLSSEDLDHFRRGIDIGDYTTAECRIVSKGSLSYEVELIEGKNRQIRRMFKALGFQVLSLQRIRLGDILLDSLNEGEWRHLAPGEVQYLKSL